MAGVAMEVVLDLHLECVVSQEVLAWDMALLMALHMASPTMVLVPMASLKDMVNLLPMANSPLPMVNNLRLLTPHRVMVKLSSSNLLVISLLNLLIPSNLLTHNLPTHSSQPTHSHLLTPSHLRMVNSLSTLKLVQLDLLGGSALSQAQDFSWIFIVHFK